MGRRQIEHTQAALQKIQEQQAQHVEQQRRPSPQTQQQSQLPPDNYGAQVIRVAAGFQRKHDEAWQRYYKAPRSCENWQSDSRINTE